MKWQGKVVQFWYWQFLHHCCGRILCLGLLCSLFQSKNPFIRCNLLAVDALNVSSVSIKQFDSIIALCTTRHVLSNTVPLSNMLRRKNINLILVTKEVGVVVKVMTRKKRPYGLGRTFFGRRGEMAADCGMEPSMAHVCVAQRHCINVLADECL